MKKKTNLCLWTMRTQTHILNKNVPVISHMWKAHGMCGTLSKKISGRGGYFFISGTRSCTTTITNAVIHVTRNAYPVNNKKIRYIIYVLCNMYVLCNGDLINVVRLIKITRVLYILHQWNSN